MEHQSLPLTARKVASNHRAASHNNLKYAFGDALNHSPEHVAHDQLHADAAPLIAAAAAVTTGGSRRSHTASTPYSSSRVSRAGRPVFDADNDADVSKTLREIKEYLVVIEKCSHLRTQSVETDAFRHHLQYPIDVFTRLMGVSAEALRMRAESSGVLPTEAREAVATEDAADASEA